MTDRDVTYPNWTPDLQETFGAMAKTEKIAFILEQVRLCLDRKDFVRYTDVTVQQASQGLLLC